MCNEPSGELKKRLKKAGKGRQAKDRVRLAEKPRKQQEKEIDEASRQSFPASDPPSWTETKAA